MTERIMDTDSGKAAAGQARNDERKGDVLFQVALLQSLAQGYFDGIIPVDELKKHGDTGIGTFEGVNGEMIVLDGVVYQALGDGSIQIAPDTETVPFSDMTFFREDVSLALSDVPDMAGLQKRLNTAVVENGANHFCMVKIQGTFRKIKVRSIWKQQKPYRELDAALAADQVERDDENVRGTMVGVYCPNYMGGLNCAGWHLHYISADLTRGGHVLQVSIDKAVVSMDVISGFQMILPGTKAFHNIDLSRNMDEEIHRAETATSERQGRNG